jgi:hypothetical protein
LTKSVTIHRIEEELNEDVDEELDISDEDDDSIYLSAIAAADARMEDVRRYGRLFTGWLEETTVLINKMERAQALRAIAQDDVNHQIARSILAKRLTMIISNYYVLSTLVVCYLFVFPLPLQSFPISIITHAYLPTCLLP